MNKNYFWAHLTSPSTYPMMSSMLMLVCVLYTIVMFHEGSFNMMKCPRYNLCMFACFLAMTMASWLYNMVLEATFEGNHTMLVQSGLKLGFMLFMLSEVMFFTSFFWAFFHSSLSPSVEIGCVWPPTGMTCMVPFGLPLMNTVILLVSGASLTCSHNKMLLGGENNNKFSFLYLFVTMFLGMLFLMMQGFEYKYSSINMSSSMYGSCFFMLTGFHGMHVLVGTIMLVMSVISLCLQHFTPNHHLLLEMSIWYWHFVDVVWLFLFIFVYWWGGN